MKFVGHPIALSLDLSSDNEIDDMYLSYYKLLLTILEKQSDIKKLLKKFTA